MRTNAEQIEKLAEVVAAAERATGAADVAVDTLDSLYQEYMSNLPGLRQALTFKVDSKLATLTARIDKGSLWKHPAFGIPVDLKADDARSLLICKTAGIPVPTAGRKRLSMADVKEGRATDSEYQVALDYRNAFNSYYHLRDMGRAWLGWDASRKATARVKAEADKAEGQAEGKGEPGKVVITRETADRYMVSIIAFCEANPVRVTAEVFAPAMGIIRAASMPEPEPIAEPEPAQVISTEPVMGPAEPTAEQQAAFLATVDGAARREARADKAERKAARKAALAA